MLTEKTVYVTEQGFADLRAELDELQAIKRPEIVRRLQEAKHDGDFMDTSETQPIEQELAFVDARIQELEDMLDHAELIQQGPEDNQVDIGETVVIQTEDGALEEYTIVGMAEADPGRGLISNESPLGQALLGHKVGEQVVVHAPVGDIRYRIVSVA